MRFLGLAVMTGAVMVMSACGGAKDTPAADTTGAMMGATTTAAMPPAMQGAAPAVTGKTVEVKMVGDEKGYRFEPAEITVSAGDGIKFIMVSGGPHNVAFNPTGLSAPAKAALMADMPEQMGELSGKMLLMPNETYTISTAGVPPGTYDFNCTPHLAMGMKGKLTVQ